jgi:GntR family transcriptional regulator, arabinose operon transcriptional repressor
MNKTLQVKNILDKHISRQRLAKQFRLPAERVLASQLGYSRATIGKALGVLEGEGVILRKKGSGTFISNNNKERTMTVALVMRTAYHYTDTHFRLIVEEVSKYAEKNNIYIQIFDRLPDMFKEKPENNSLMAAINNKIIDGVLVVSRMPLGIISQISAACPTVFINNILGNGSEISCVSCDHFRVGFLAGKYLLEKGHRKVAYMTDSLAHPESTFEFSGFKSALEMGGVEIKETDILETRQNIEILSKRVLHFLKDSTYTACFERNSCYALKIMSVLQNNGIRVPEDISIIAGGNYRNNGHAIKKLTIINNQLEKMCQMGLEILQDIIKNNNKTRGGLKLLSPEIVEHDSVIDINQK